MLNLTLLIDALFAVMACILVKNIFSQKKLTLIIPFVICIIAVATLLLFYISNTTEIANVWLNSHSSTPLIYKICGIWGNHEGSMLLFFTCLTAWSALLLRENNAICLASFVLLALGCYLYFQANPFVVLAIKVTSGQDLNPALQNLYLTIHPPILYLGQSLCLVLWVWACLSPNHPKMQLYTRICLGLITTGLILGARWACGELGWGGFWFWDPVETVSLFPWLAIMAAVHAEKSNRKCLLLSFPMVMLGLSLVRSGILVSVHSFGFDLQNGIWLGLCAILVCIATVIILFKATTPKISLVSIGFISCLALLIALIFIPIILNYCLGINAVIDEKFFHDFINPLTLFLLIFCGFAPYMKFRQYEWSIACAILSTILWVWKFQPHFNYFATFAAVISFWLVFSSLKYCKQLFNKGFVGAHLGVGLCILGASHGEIFTEKLELKISELPVKLGHYIINYKSQAVIDNQQIHKEILNFSVDSTEISPEILYFYTNKVIKNQSAWVRVNFDHVHSTIFTDSNNTWATELMLKPMITLFWIGLLFVIFGIFISILQNFKKTSQLNC